MSEKSKQIAMWLATGVLTAAWLGMVIAQSVGAISSVDATVKGMAIAALAATFGISSGAVTAAYNAAKRAAGK